MMKRFLLSVTAIAVNAGITKADVAIGIAGPVSGQYAPFYEQVRRGAEAAAKAINDAGGVDVPSMREGTRAGSRPPSTMPHPRPAAWMVSIGPGELSPRGGW